MKSPVPPIDNDGARRSTLLSGGIAGLFLAVTIVVAFFAMTADRSLNRETYDDSGIAPTQIRLHYELLVSELKGLAITPELYSVPGAVRQYDILYGRLNSLPTRPPYPEIFDRETRTLIARIFETVDGHVGIFDAAASSGESAGIVATLPSLESLRPDVERLSGRSFQLASDFRSDLREDSLRALDFLLVAVGGLVVSSGLFVILLIRSLRANLERARQLANARDEAVRANLAKSEFLAHMSHDLRTPLNAIIGYSYLIHSESGGPVGEPYTTYAKTVGSAGEHLLHLINELLDIARIESGQYELEKSDIDVQELLENCRGIIRPKADERHVSIKLDVDSALTMVADENKVRQACINILENAVKFSPKHSEITVTAGWEETGFVFVSVIDQGPGIDKGALETILQPFGQIEDQSPDVANDGIGLGLAIVKAIMDAHDGQIRISSNPSGGTGTKVTLCFPKDQT